MFEQVQTVRPERRRHCERFYRTGLRVSGRLLARVFGGVALLVMLVMSATAHESGATGCGEASRGLDLGIDCSTETVPVEIAPRHFVLNRITRCVPVLPANSRGRSQGKDWIDDAAGPSKQVGNVVSIRPKPTAAQLPSWSPRRDRFSNAQYASSLISLRQTIRPVSR